MENRALWKRALAEFSAVFLLASIGLMTVATALTTGAYGLFELSIAFGFAITVMVVVSAAVSGGHFNPAITIMLAAFRRFPWRDVPVYIAAQISGGVLGALVLYFFFSGPIRAFEAASKITRGQPNSSLSGMIFACYSPNPAIAAAQKWPLSIVNTPTAVLAEAFATLILAIVVFAAVDTRNSFAPNLLCHCGVEGSFAASRRSDGTALSLVTTRAVGWKPTIFWIISQRWRESSASSQASSSVPMIWILFG